MDDCVQLTGSGGCIYCDLEVEHLAEVCRLRRALIEDRDDGEGCPIDERPDELRALRDQRRPGAFVSNEECRSHSLGHE